MTPIERTREYIASIDLTKVQLVILGKDAYPTEPTGVAFCKQDWKALTAGNCSGLYVLQALGVDWAAEERRQPERLPPDLFERLAISGVVFLNASYSADVGGRFTLRDDLNALVEAYELNRSILAVAKTVIRCGEAKRMDWVPDVEPEAKYQNVVHPDKRNSTNRHVKKDWNALWGNPGSLAGAWPVKSDNISVTNR